MNGKSNNNIFNVNDLKTSKNTKSTFFFSFYFEFLDVFLMC